MGTVSNLVSLKHNPPKGHEKMQRVVQGVNIYISKTKLGFLYHTEGLRAGESFYTPGRETKGPSSSGTRVCHREVPSLSPYAYVSGQRGTWHMKKLTL